MYHFSTTLDCSFEEAIARTTEALKLEGLGVLTEIDVKGAFKKKLDKDFRNYRILGACHPGIAYQMIEADDKAGVFYPCNVVVQEHAPGQVEVSAVDPLMMFISIHSPKAKEVALEGSGMMQRVINLVETMGPVECGV